jgi:hypothetical protein
MSVLHTLWRSFAADGMKMMVMQLEALMKQKSKQNKQQSMGKAGNFFCSLAPYCNFSGNFSAR